MTAAGPESPGLSLAIASFRHCEQKQSACSSAISGTCGNRSHQHLSAPCADPQVKTAWQREQIFSVGEFTID
jgi:hypothetical protein